MMKRIALILASLLGVAVVAGALLWRYLPDEAIDALDRGDYATAVPLLTEDARNGDVAAQYTLGVLYLNGRGVKQDREAAFKLIRMAAEHGHVKAAGLLGVLYAQGFAVKADDAEAAKWLRVAAEKGVESA